MASTRLVAVLISAVFMWSAVAADPRQKEAAPANGLAGAGHRRRKTGPRYVVDVDQRHRPVTRRPQSVNLPALDWPEFFDFSKFENTRHAWSDVNNNFGSSSLNIQRTEPFPPLRNVKTKNPHQLVDTPFSKSWEEKPPKGTPPRNIQELIGATQTQRRPTPPRPAPARNWFPKKKKNKKRKSLITGLFPFKQRSQPQARQPELAPVIDLAGHRLQPKRTLSNTIKILLNMPPVMETPEEHMANHMKRDNSRFRQRFTPSLDWAPKPPKRFVTSLGPQQLREQQHFY